MGTRAAIAAAAALLVLVAAGSLFPAYLFHWDEIQLTLGLARFDLGAHQPHPPGYYVLVFFGRALLPYVADRDDALRWVAAGGAAAFAALVAALAPRGLPKLSVAALALAASAFVICSPIVSFYAVSALTYTCEGACWTAILLGAGGGLRGRRLAALGLAIGASAGLRPTLLIWGVAAIVILWVLARERPRAAELVVLAAGMAGGVLAWAIPMLIEVGGLANYVALCRPLLTGNIWRNSVFHQGAAELQARIVRMAADGLLAAGPLLLVAVPGVVARLRRATRERVRRFDALLVGSAIAACFYAVFIYDTSGYVLSVVLPLVAYGLLTLGAIVHDRHRAIHSAAIAAAVASAALLALLPGGLVRGGDVGYGRLAGHDAKIAARVAAVRASFAPRETVLVTSYEYWEWSFRHVMHYLPEYTTLQLIGDPYLSGSSADRPYLAARERRIFFAGPDGFDLRALEPGLRQVVYMIPDDVGKFVAQSCAESVRALRVSPTEVLAVLPAEGVRTVLARASWIECR